MEVSISDGPPGEAGAPGQGEGGKTGAGDGEDSLEQPEWSEEGPAECDGEEEGVAHPATCIGSRYGADLARKFSCKILLLSAAGATNNVLPDGVLMSD